MTEILEKFSPILIMEYIRQVTVNRFLNSDTMDFEVKFKIPQPYYEEIKNYPIQAQMIRLETNYDEAKEILSVKTDEILLNRFREQKSLLEIAGKYETQYQERYRPFISVID